MKILAMCSNSSPSGSVLRTKYIIRELSALGYEAEMIPPARKRDLPFYTSLSTSYSLLIYLSNALKRKYDILYVSKALPNTCIPALLMKQRNAKIIIDIDDLSWSYHSNVLIRNAIRSFEESFIPHFELIATQNNPLLNYALKHLKIERKRLCFLPNGVDTNLFNPFNFNGNIYRERLGIKEEKMLLYMAHLDISTELEFILDMFKGLIADRKVHARLVIVGTGTKQRYYQNLVKSMKLEDCTIFTGYINLTDLPGYVSAADVCLVYYSDRLANYFRTSMKLREYLAMGKPVVCNTLGDLAEFKDFTYQFPTGDMKLFKEKVLQILDGEYNTDRIIFGQRYIVEKLSWKRIVKEFEKEMMTKLLN